MIIQFTLSMPNRGSWNGGWSGENNLYAIVKKFTTIKAREKADKILCAGSYYYQWSDGWGASVDVKEIDSLTSRRARKASRGFCGYDWMVESILNHGAIYASHEIPKTVATEKEIAQ